MRLGAGDAWADSVTELLVDRLAAAPSLRVALPTGSTPLPVYDRLPGALARRGVSMGEATVVLLDEYLGLAAGHPARCDAVLRRRLLDRLSAAPRFVAFAVDEREPDEASARMEAEIGMLGGLDLVVLGLGRNGHVGMNEPGSGPDSRTRPVDLAPSTVDAARAYGADPPPTRGVTLGLATILEAREIWLLATGARKRSILGAALEGPITPAVPASLLRMHPRLRVLADDEAAA